MAEIQGRGVEKKYQLEAEKGDTPQPAAARLLAEGVEYTHLVYP